MKPSRRHEESWKLVWGSLRRSFSATGLRSAGNWRDKQRIMELYESNAWQFLCQLRERNRKSDYTDINDAVYMYEWYRAAISKNVYPPRWQLVNWESKSNIWTSQSHWFQSIQLMALSMECETYVISSRLNPGKRGYLRLLKCTVLNTGEMGWFWKALPDKGLGQMKWDCKCGKKCKQNDCNVDFQCARGSESPPILVRK